MMKRTIALITVILIAGAGVWNYHPSRAQQMGPPAPFRVAVVNMTKVVGECKETLDRQKLTQTKRQGILDDLKMREAEVNALKAAIDANVFKPGTEEYNKQCQSYFEKVHMIQAIQEGQEQVFDADAKAWMENLYVKITAEITKIALQEGYSLVLNYDEMEMTMPNLNALQNMIFNRKIVYRSANIDITDQVIKNMDAIYDLIK